MRRVINHIPFIIIFLIFKNWFISETVIGGDWPYFFNETIREFPLFTPSWSSFHGNGLGGIIPDYFLNQYLYFTTFFSLKILHIPWEIGYKIFWFGGFIVLSVFSSIYFVKTAFHNRIETWQMSLTALLYTANTYILMVVGGGQMGVVLAYAIAPLVLAKFMEIIQNRESRIQDSIIAGLVLAMQVMFDPRIAFISGITVFLCFMLCSNYKFSKKYIFYVLFIIPLITFLLNSSWALPFLIFHYNPIEDLGSAIPTVAGLKFFSFASLPQTISLLHPNWPENIFGKIFFMKSEFLLLPIIAYSSLLFLKSSMRKNILFFSLIGLIGAFLAKGANPPFGELNIWIFEHIPGFGVFRDPTKFYIMIALSYSILIPYAFSNLLAWIKAKFNNQNSKLSLGSQKYLSTIFLLSFFLYLVFLLKPAILDELSGTFRNNAIPKEYVDLKNFLYNQPDFFRTLWMPRQQRFSFTSYNHPAVEVDRLLGASNSAEMIEQLEKKDSQVVISEKSIKYIIVPYDSLGEIFLYDRKYDEKQYQNVIKQLSNVSWLKKIEGFGKLAVFEVPEYKDHFRLEGEGDISYKMINPVHYSLTVRVPESTNIIFSENYSPYWFAKSNEIIIESKKTSNNLNSFYLAKAGEYNLELYFLQNQYYTYGHIISLTSIGIILLVLVMLRFRTFL